MHHKTRGIVLHSTAYNDINAITLIYTEEFGPVSYLTAIKPGKKNRIPKSLFYPMSVLDMEVDHQNLRQIQRIKEARSAVFLTNILSNPIKVSISLFLAEFLSKILRELEPNTLLFDFLVQSLQILDLTENGYSNFHLVFLIKLSRFLGFYPNSENTNGIYFDMKNGEFVHFKPHNQHLNLPESTVFRLLLRMDYKNMSSFRFSSNDRQMIISRILDYYRIHLVDFPPLKSLDILHEVFG